MTTKRKNSLIIVGKPDYINHMYKHLRQEHPSTRSKMRIEKTNLSTGWGLRKVSSVKFGRELKKRI